MAEQNVLIKKAQEIVTKIFQTPIGIFITKSIDNYSKKSVFYQNNLHDLFATNAKSLSKYTSDINLFFEGLYKLFADSTYSQFAAKHFKVQTHEKN